MVRRRRSSGTTLVELTITLVIFVLLALTVAPILIHIARFYQLSRARLTIQRDARIALDTMNRFLRQAQAGTVAIDQLSNQPAHSRIRFTTIDGQAMSYYQSGRSLYQVRGSTAVLSANLRNVTFTYPRSDDPTIVSVGVTMEAATYEGKSKVLELAIEKVRVMN